MGLVVNTNIASLAAQRNLTVSTEALQRSVERLSSGLRITRAADDAAGLGV
ncbi:MAG: flagellin FliC, partial [Nitrospiraceae bacterium]